uniref:C2H2-type domain-containing protein n=1 Tax=Knipowitschia caucasica TaxID=637954 RepID=A0AAV2LUR5_KNICA
MHSRSPDFRLVCGIDGCLREYRVYNSFYYHVKRTHTHHLFQVQAEGGEEESSSGMATASLGRAEEDDVAAVNTAEVLNEDGQSNGSESEAPARVNTLGINLSKQATAFLLQAREANRLTQRAVNQMVTATQQYQASLVEHLRLQVNRVFEQHSEDLGSLKTEAMAVFDQFADPFSEISTTHLQDKKIKELLQPVEPEAVMSKQTTHSNSPPPGVDWDSQKATSFPSPLRQVAPP